MENILNKVRLEQFQYDAIIQSFKKCFLADDHLWIFGSRADMKKRGGDIDLYVETHAANVDDAYNFETKFVSQVWAAIGEQKIDVVLNLVDIPGESLSIYKVAREEGVQLV